MSEIKYHLVGDENVTKSKQANTRAKSISIALGCVPLTIIIIIYVLTKSKSVYYGFAVNDNATCNNDLQVPTANISEQLKHPSKANTTMTYTTLLHTSTIPTLTYSYTATVGHTTAAHVERTSTEMPTTQTFINNLSSLALSTHVTTKHKDMHSSTRTIAEVGTRSPLVQTSLSVKHKLPPQKYFVYTPECHMPYVDPFTRDALKIFKPQKYKKCSKDADMVTSKLNKIQRRYVLHLNRNQTDVNCCYQEIVRSGSGAQADKKYKALPCANFHQDFLVPEHIDALIMNCTDRKTKKLLQISAFSFIQRKAELRPPKNATRHTTRRPSILMIGIDSLSRINFRRNMPLTRKYLNAKRWFELEGYNKVGDNTFPNLMALLTGHNESRAYKMCNPKIVGGLQKCVFTWDYYKAQGYRTAYAEDWVAATSFNYLKKGFLTPPTDYYLRPLTIAMERLLHVKKEAGIPFCLGQRHYLEYIYDYALQLTDFYENETEPVFGFFWTNSISHNDFSKSSGMDTRMLKYFQTMERNGVLERAIVIFFSDHGMRFGPLRKLSSGFLEERLPMFHISLPQWFQAAHPDFVAALNVNKNRLTSPYDIHKTLNHILEIGNAGLSLPSPASCSKCQSIFKEVPLNRTCTDAGILEHWCTCGSFESIEVTKNTLVKNVSQLIVDEMNAYIRTKKFDGICAILTLKSIKNAEYKLVLNTDHHLIYRIKYETNPKSASFEATVSYDALMKFISLDVETISRLNTYEPDSYCIEDKQAKKYCICKK